MGQLKNLSSSGIKLIQKKNLLSPISSYLEDKSKDVLKKQKTSGGTGLLGRSEKM